MNHHWEFIQICFIVSIGILMQHILNEIILQLRSTLKTALLSFLPELLLCALKLTYVGMEACRKPLKGLIPDVC